MMTTKFIVLALCASLCILPSAVSLAAFSTDDVLILEQKDITLLKDEKLIETYIDILAEMEASRTFHTTSGFTPKEYKKYKELVRYRLRLLFEINRRKIELPPSVN